MGKAASLIFAWIAFLSLIALVVFAVIQMVGESLNPPVCTVHSKVVSIDALYMRGGEISLSNGMHHVKASSVKPGDDFCLHWKMWKLDDIFSK